MTLLRQCARLAFMGSTELIGATEASTILGRSVRMIQRLAKEGKLPIAQKMPGQTGAYLFDRDTVEQSRGVIQ